MAPDSLYRSCLFLFRTLTKVKPLQGATFTLSTLVFRNGFHRALLLWHGSIQLDENVGLYHSIQHKKHIRFISCIIFIVQLSVLHFVYSVNALVSFDEV